MCVFFFNLLINFFILFKTRQTKINLKKKKNKIIDSPEARINRFNVYICIIYVAFNSGLGIFFK